MIPISEYWCEVDNFAIGEDDISTAVIGKSNFLLETQQIFSMYYYGTNVFRSRNLIWQDLKVINCKLNLSSSDNAAPQGIIFLKYSSKLRMICAVDCQLSDRFFLVSNRQKFNCFSSFSMYTIMLSFCYCQAKKYTSLSIQWVDTIFQHLLVRFFYSDGIGNENDMAL